MTRLRLLNTNHDGYRGVVNNPGFAHTPVDIVAFAWVINRLVAFIAIAKTALAIGFTAAVVVGDDVIFPVHRVATGAYPRDW